MRKFIPCYLLGGLIAISWAALPDHGPWDQWELAVFHLVNGWLGQMAFLKTGGGRSPPTAPCVQAMSDENTHEARTVHPGWRAGR